jgi:NAD(P)-dependent dehydrogenase (short-subunit alcohol dehydrogenase family)
MTAPVVRTALVTGGSRGLGLALARGLAEARWQVIVDARDARRLDRAVAALDSGSRIVAVPGDVADPEHRAALRAQVERAGRLDLLVNNASTLGPTPLRRLADLSPADLAGIFAVNTFAPLQLIQLLLPVLERSHGAVVNVSSDAAVEAYEGWGGYGCAKAALEALGAVLAVEHPGLRVHSFDPGDMDTELAAAAFDGADTSDRPAPESVVPALLRLIDPDVPSGRYRAVDLASARAAR